MQIPLSLRSQIIGQAEVHPGIHLHLQMAILAVVVLEVEVMEEIHHLQGQQVQMQLQGLVVMEL